MKKLAAALLAALMVASAAPAALAAPAPGGGSGGDIGQSSREKQNRLEDMAEKFEALSDAQRQKIYRLDEDISRRIGKLALLYGQYGLLDERSAEKIAELARERSELARLEGNLPGVLGGM